MKFAPLRWIKRLFEVPPIPRLTPYSIESGYSWLETIVFFDDRGLERYGDYCMGMYHCKHCDTYEGFCEHLPKDVLASKVLHNSRNKFWRSHAHGDGRIILFERDMDSDSMMHIAE